MADQKKWFKVWATILLDPDHSNMSVQDVGRWTRLGALMVSQGDNGRLLLIPPAKAFVLAMECDTFETAISAIKMLPNVHIEECKFDNGKTAVIMLNWFKYQVDSTGYERVKRSRYKRRGEESRKEEKRKEESTPAPNHFVPPTPDQATAYARTLGFELDGKKFCAHYGSSGWMRGKTKIKDWKQCVVTWKPEGTYASHDSQSPVSYAAIARAKRKDESLRKDAPAGEVHAGIRDLPDVPTKTSSGNGR